MSDSPATKPPIRETRTVALVNTTWDCELCHAQGIVRLDGEATIGELMRQSIAGHTELSPNCVFDRTRVRVMVGWPPAGTREE